MKCGIKNCINNADRNLWKCAGTCERLYHSSCIGVQRNQEDLLRTFALPICLECQEKFLLDMDVKKLLEHQNVLLERLLKEQHKTDKQLTHLHTVMEAVDALENKVCQIKEGLELISKKIDASTDKACNKLKTQLEIMNNEISDHFGNPTPADKHITKKIDNITMAVSTLDKKLDYSLLERESRPNTEPGACHCSTTEILHEVRALSSAVTGTTRTSASICAPQTEIPIPLYSLADEIAATKVIQSQKTHQPSLPTKNVSPPTNLSGWRWIGEVRRWKNDWSEFDAKLERRRKEEKSQAKAQRRKLQQRRKSSSNHSAHKEAFVHPESSLDRILIAAAKSNFSGPYSDSKGPINFQKGEIINPYRTPSLHNHHHAHQPQHYQAQQQQPQEQQQPPAHQSQHHQAQQEHLQQQHQTPHKQQTQHTSFLDPMRPPTVRITETFSDGDGLYLKSRLRDSKIMHVVRLYLSFLHDKEPFVCVGGTTCISARTFLASEGLPTAYEKLKKFFIDVHEEYGISQSNALADLDSYGKYLQSERICHLQRANDSSKKFYNTSNFQKH